MRWIATLLSVTAAVVFLTNCAGTPYAYGDFDQSYTRAVNDSAYNQRVCQSSSHDLRFCR